MPYIPPEVVAKAKEMDYIDAGKALCEGKLWDEAAAQF